jgi:micrococcal nuclease
VRLTRREQRTQRSRRWIMVTVGLLSLFMLSVTLRWFAGVVMRGHKAPFAAEPTVTDVIDGDTIDVRVGREVIRVRLLGIDTPETKDPRRPVQCFGPEAASRTEQLLPPGTIVQLEADRETNDVFGRTLAYVHRNDGLFVNLSLLSEGFADVLIISPNVAHSNEFRAAVAAARSAQKGLWGACGGPDVASGTG